MYTTDRTAQCLVEVLEELSTKQRARIPKGKFVFPARRAWPIQSAKQACTALDFVVQKRGKPADWPKVVKAVAKAWGTNAKVAAKLEDPGLAKYLGERRLPWPLSTLTETKRWVSFGECEHAGDMADYAAAMRKCGLKVLQTQMGSYEDEECSILASGPASAWKKFMKTDEGGFAY